MSVERDLIERGAYLYSYYRRDELIKEGNSKGEGLIEKELNTALEYLKVI